MFLEAPAGLTKQCRGPHATRGPQFAHTCAKLIELEYKVWESQIIRYLLYLFKNITRFGGQKNVPSVEERSRKHFMVTEILKERKAHMVY